MEVDHDAPTGPWGPLPTLRPRRARAVAPFRELPEDWLNPDEACAYLRLPSLKALYQAVRRGTVPVHRMGRLLRFRRPELDQVLTGSAAL
jgi:excisionase family DNA binding protein